MQLKSVRPLGTFHARQTKDWEAQCRDGETFFLMNELESIAPGVRALEIMFGDGMWMLATDADIELI